MWFLVGECFVFLECGQRPVFEKILVIVRFYPSRIAAGYLGLPRDPKGEFVPRFVCSY